MIKKLFVSENDEDCCLEVFETEKGNCSLVIEDLRSESSFNIQLVTLNSVTLEVLISDLTDILNSIK